MTFDQWLETRPYAGLLSEGTVKLMEHAWDAGQNQLVITAGMTDKELESSVRMRGDIRD